MATSPVTVEAFTGLNLKADPFAVGATGAVSASNVLFDHPGLLRTRPGYASFSTADTIPTRVHVARDDDTGVALVTGFNNSAVYALDASGATLATAASQLAYSFANYGTPSASATYFARAGSSVIGKWNGAAFSTVAIGYGGLKMALDHAGTRLALANITDGTGSYPSRVRFSNAGDAEVFAADNYIDLDPGDFDGIAELVRWQGQLFAFKRSKFYVFYGESIDSDGGAGFEYRTIDTGKGPWGNADAATVQTFPMACATPDGVAFVARDGIYVTSGGAPVKVSAALDPWFRGESVSGFPTLDFPMAVSFAGGLLYVLPAGASATIVGDPRTGWWSTFNKAILSAADFPYASTPGVLWGLSGTGVVKHDETRTTDSGSAIVWSAKSGRYPLGEHGRVACTQESSLIGSGTVALRLDTDAYSNQNGSATLGTAPAVAEGWPAGTDQEGLWFEHTLSGSGIATVAELTHHIAFVKPPGVR